MKVKTHKKLYDLLKVTKGFRDRARNSGQIFWTHCPMLNPPYFTLAMVRNLLLSSSHSDVLFGNVGCSRRQRHLSSQSLPCLRSSREAAFLVTQPQLPTETVHWVGLGAPTKRANPELPQCLGIEHLWVPRGNRWC